MDLCADGLLGHVDPTRRPHGTASSAEVGKRRPSKDAASRCASESYLFGGHLQAPITQHAPAGAGSAAVTIISPSEGSQGGVTGTAHAPHRQCPAPKPAPARAKGTAAVIERQIRERTAVIQPPRRRVRLRADARNVRDGAEMTASRASIKARCATRMTTTTPR